jgi:hypothetical protein
MKKLTTFMVLVAFSAVMDRSFNHGLLTVHVAETAADARDWTLSSTDKVTATVTGYGRS